MSLLKWHKALAEKAGCKSGCIQRTLGRIYKRIYRSIYPNTLRTIVYKKFW
jgi:hypothetical protein